MLNSGTTCVLLSSFLTVSTTLAGIMVPSIRTQAQEALSDEAFEEVVPDASSSIEVPTEAEIPELVEDEDLKPLNNNVLSLQAGERLMTEAQDSVTAQNYENAAKKYKEARQVFKLVASFHQALSKSFSGVDRRVAEEQRNKAFQALQMRDESTYRLALVHRAQNRSELAVPLLVQIIGSQDPTRDLGQKAYQQLFEIGFVDIPYPRTAEGSAP